MRAVIYTVYHRTQWTWRVSLDATLCVDKLFWSSMSGDQRVTSMFRVAEEPPYGEAVAMAAEMNGRAMGEGEISSQIERLSLNAVLLESVDAKEKSDSAEKNDSENVDTLDGWLTLLVDDIQFWDKLRAAMKGRSLLWEELVSLLEYLGLGEAAQQWKRVVQWAYLNGDVELNVSLEISDKRSLWGWRKRAGASCRRCGHSGEQIRWSDCASCGSDSCAYCESCLTMGRTRACAPLIMGANETSDAMSTRGLVREGRGIVGEKTREIKLDEDPLHDTAPFIPIGDWQLSPAQLAASEAGIRHLLSRDRISSYKSFLIWAVTGAGKTEMIFPLVATELQRGGKVLIATPRRDVVLELLPRIKAAFPQQIVIALYGGSTQRWELGDITIATTHQLLRYEKAFDLVVVDEIDAFPYHNNPVLEYAAQKVRSPEGATVLLSATPPAHLQVDAQKGRIAHVKVPVRYHGKPLPTPRLIRYGGIHKLPASSSNGANRTIRWLPSRDGSGQLADIVSESLERGAQIFIFIPAIHRLESTLAWVRRRMDKLCSRAQIEATSSQDEDRHEKVLRFREGAIRILLTTTILERGVTIPKADVVVLDADSALFDTAALVQMAGRAGRSAADPFGKVHYLSREHTRAQAEAVSQIRAMNRLAERRGYFL
ncbi:MAG: helicase-related protein [Paenibacillaceae bacterium]